MRRAWRAAGAANRAGLLVAVLAATGCAASLPGAPEPRDGDARLLAQDAVLVRGWIGGQTAGLEPVTPLRAAAANAGNPDGPFRLRGFDDRGAVLFDMRFDETSLAGTAGRAERHFALAVPLAAGGAESLAAVVFDAGEGRTVNQQARWPRTALRDDLTGGQGVQLAILSPTRVAVTWDAGRFALLQLRDPATGSVLALDSDGEVTVTVTGGELEIALSDGVRSAAALFRTAENP